MEGLEDMREDDGDVIGFRPLRRIAGEEQHGIVGFTRRRSEEGINIRLVDEGQARPLAQGADQDRWHSLLHKSRCKTFKGNDKQAACQTWES
ncbi:hypothetical protein AJ87_10770 [Rhizobium yanglingense]|nr:hypothetical protein AJ87_10770 [Rhizobium yanglingense]